MSERRELVLRLRGADVTSTVISGDGVFEREFPALVGKYPKSFILTDTNVNRLYGNRIDALSGGAAKFVMPAGEKHKQPEQLFAILRAMAEAGLHRDSCLFAVGGGVVGDVGGLAAALYMRGIACVQVPTTVLSQVDSSVGGKTAVDLGDVKNLVGAFKQPETVLADGTFFQTLPKRELRCGLGEIIKHGALDGELFDGLWNNRARLFDLDYLSSVVPLNIAFKARVVSEDEREAGVRKSLNLGHTTGHALELSDGKYSHGEYVLVGMLFEGALAKKYVACDEEYLRRLSGLALYALGGMPPLSSAKEAAKFAKLDKKNGSDGDVVITAPVSKGKYALIAIPYAEYERGLEEIQEKLC